MNEAELREQVDLLFEHLREKQIDIHQFMKLLRMVYGDYLDCHLEEHPYYNDKQRIEQAARRGSAN